MSFKFYVFGIKILNWHWNLEASCVSFRDVRYFDLKFLKLLQQLFLEAIQGGTMEGFYRLIAFFQTQSEPAYCGLATLSMVLNALAIDPGRKWKGTLSSFPCHPLNF